MSAHSNSYRPEIDGLRAVAILLVIVFHSGFGWIDGGFVGVDVFFVISGYLIGGLLLSEHSRSGGVSLREFWGRRARRLLPLSSLVIAVTVIGGMIVSVPVARQQISIDATSAALYVSNWTFAGQAVAYSERTVNDGLFTQFWSLSIEEQFYLLLPLIFLAVIWWSRREPARFVRRLFGVVSALVIASFASSIWAIGARGTASYFLTYTRLWELGIGVLMAIWFQRRPVRLSKRTDVLALAGLALIVGSALTFDEKMAYPGWRATIPVLGTALVVVFAARTASITHRILSTRVLVVLGLWSYGWYLWHWPTIAIASLAAQRWFPTVDSDLLVVAAILLSLLLAAITYRLIENPVRYWPRVANFPSRSLALGVSLTVFAAVIGPATLSGFDTGDQLFAATSSAMSPAQAKADYTRFGGSRRCLELPIESDVESACVFGDLGGSVTIGLIGDSHAFHWLPALHQAGLDHHWRVIVHAKAGCPATPARKFILIEGATDRSARRPYVECEIWQKEMLTGLQDEGPFDAIIVSSAYAYLESLRTDDGSAASSAEAAAIWSTQSRTLYQQLLRISPVVIRLADTPWPEKSVPECLSEHRTLPQRCAIDVSTRAHRDGSVLAIERAVAPSGVIFADLTNSICPSDPCPVRDSQGIVKYHDAHHLTETYSFSLSDDVAAVVLSALATLDVRPTK